MPLWFIQVKFNTLNKPFIWFSLISAFTFFIYLQGVNGPFLYDDQANLIALENFNSEPSYENALNIIMGNHSLLGRPVAMASFILNAGGWPSDPYQFKLTNILIHLIIGGLIFTLSIKLIRHILPDSKHSNEHLLGLITAGFWLIHPLHVSTTLYIVQRMTQLSALFSILAVITYLHYYKAIYNSNNIKKYLIPCILLFILISLAVFSKENALLVFPIILLIHFFRTSNTSSVLYKIWLNLFIILPIVICIFYLTTKTSSFSQGYEYKGFTLIQRLITELNVVRDYLTQIFIPDYRTMSLFHDDFKISNTLFDKDGILSLTLYSILITLLFTKINPIYKFSITWFFVWHMMESSAIPLDLYFEHRNYVASFGPLWGLTYGIINFNNFSQSTKPKISIIVSAAYGIFLAIQLGTLTNIWKSDEGLYMNWLTYHEKSNATLLSLVSLYGARGDIILALNITNKALEFDHAKNDIAINLKRFNLECILKKDTTSVTEKLLNITKEKSNYTPYITPVYINLIQRILKSHCIPPDHSKLNIIISQIAEHSPQNNNGGWLSNFYIWHSAYYLYQDSPKSALDLYTKAYRKHRSTNTIIAIIDLTLHLKDYKSGQEWIDIATAFNSKNIRGNRNIKTDLKLLQSKLDVMYNKKIIKNE